MGNVATIAHDKWPRQGRLINQRVRVFFHYDTSHMLEGWVLRDDAEPPHRTIIRLDDGRLILTDECQYSEI